MQRLLAILCLALLAGCAAPVENMSFVSPGKGRWVAIEQAAPDASKDELLPSVRLRLASRWGGGPVIFEGAESLCGSTVLWTDDANLLLRVPADRAPFLRVKDGDLWKGVTLHVALHEDMVKMEKWSKDGLWRLVVIQTCETENWNLYLRRAGEPTFNEAMKTGWDDPDLFGGFEATQPPIELKWTGLRSAEIQVPGKSYGVTTRRKIGEVTLSWKFLAHYKVPEGNFQKLEPIKR
jgi:hypothetical protein